MEKHSIKDLERISGIKAHTIRAWEQRYGILKPERTDTNIRYYSGDDLKLLLNISLLNADGMRISEIAKMSEEEIHEAVLSHWSSCEEYENQISMLTVAMLEKDEKRFEKILNQNILQLGFERTMIKVIFPFFEKVGLLWQAGSISPAQEHFISNLVRQKLTVAIDGQMLPNGNALHKYVLFLPEGEYHELGLLFANYVIRSRGNKVIYLGQSLPLDSLIESLEMDKPDYVFTMITSRSLPVKIDKLTEVLDENFTGRNVLIAGQALEGEEENLPDKFILLKDGEELLQFLKERSLESEKSNEKSRTSRN